MAFNLKTLSILVCVTVIYSHSFGQQSDWQKATNWTLYNIQGKSGWRVPIDSMHLLDHKSLNVDSMRQFLTHTNIITNESAPVWMGTHFTTCILNGKLRKVEISTYGGFFYDEIDKKYYEIEADSRNYWLEYLAKSGAELQSRSK